MKAILLLCFSFFTVGVAVGQQVLLDPSSYNIQFQDEEIRIEENIGSFQWDQMPFSSKYQNGYYGWVQFFDTPTQEIQDEFKNKGLELIEYLPNKAYVFYFPENTSIQYLKDNGVRAIVPIEGKYKLSAALKMQSYPDYAINGNNIMVMLEFHDHANSIYVIEELAKRQITLRQEYKRHNIINLSVPNDGLEALANLPFVKWIQAISGPVDNHDTRGRSLHRSNNLDTQTPTGRNYTGVGIGVMVRDDALIGPHIDFQGRLDNSDNPDQFDTDHNHGDGVAGIMAGAGNLNPSIRGMAAGADIYNVEKTQDFLDDETTDLIYNGTVQITNTSSGFACQNEYTLNATIVDQQIKELPSLLHVLSAGNGNGNLDCNYGAGDQWGNLGGANKTGKNIIAVGNVTFNGIIHQTSSRGPAADGRIKPDIAANGAGQISTDENNEYYTIGGTSAAAPGIVGIAAQLYEAYADENGGTLPPSALIKATMLNTANDAGNIGPDYIYGWGIVNALRAVKIIEEESYLSDEITQGSTNNHTINIPSGVAQVKFMVYWSDVPGTVNANPALVNDLDLVVNDPANNTLQPWILDPTPTVAALSSPATNGPDHLNNMEQVLINNPTAGDYTLDISGFNVPVGPQEYFIIYEIISDNITVTYPNGGESFVPGETEVIYWDAVNTTENFNLEYSIDGGANWTNIATVSSNTTNYVWSVPSTVTGSGLIRVSSGSFTDTSDINFSMTSQVAGFAFSEICPDEITFVWDELVGAESYDVYLLGTKYMEVVGNSTTTSITVPIADPMVVLWAAIVAKNDTENWTSRRTIAISSAGDVLNCQLTNDIALIEIGNEPDDFSTLCSNTGDVIISITINNMGFDPQSNFELSYQLSGQAAVTEIYTETLIPGQQSTYDFTIPLSIPTTGLYTLSVSTNLTSDQNEFNDVASLDFFGIPIGTALDFEENFETSGVPSDGWSIINGDMNRTWVEESEIVGSNGNITTAAFVDNYNYEFGAGQEDFLITEYFDLAAESAASLSFDLAKAPWNANLVDGLRVDITIDCGETFISVYEKSGTELPTITSQMQAEWRPSAAAHWRTEEIDLSPYQGESAQFRFVNISGYGNSTFIDNINLSQIIEVLDNDVAIIEIGNEPNDFTTLCANTEEVIISTTISNTGLEPQNNFEVSYQVSGQAAVTEIYTETLIPGQQINYDFTTPLSIVGTGSYSLSISTSLTGDQNEMNDVATLDFFATTIATALDFEENFETNDLPADGWSIINADNNKTWLEASEIIGSDGNTTTAVFVDNYSYESGQGAEDFLVTEYFDLTSAGAATLNFDLAKVQWNENRMDGLRVEISIDCGETFTSIYDKTGLDLATLPNFNNTTLWEPSTADHWRIEQIDLAEYIGESAQFRFVNISGNGNSTYIDNVNLSQTLLGINESILSNFKLFPNPATETINLTLSSQMAADASVVITNSMGQTISYQELGATTVIDVSDYNTGLYFVTIIAKGVSETKKLLVCP